MRVGYFQNLFAYNNWAWDQVFASLEQVNEREYQAERPFFWGSLHGLAVHGLTAEWIWLSRIKGESPQQMLVPADYAAFPAVKAHWMSVRQDWGKYLDSLADSDLSTSIEYRNTRGNGFTLVLQDILLHVFNHATEHRSQMTPILYQLGHPTPALDYLFFSLRHR